MASVSVVNPAIITEKDLVNFVGNSEQTVEV